MAIRNFWFNASIDGRLHDVSGGPSPKDGEMRIEIKQRANGKPIDCCVIDCIERDGMLITFVKDSDGNVIYQFVTER